MQTNTKLGRVSADSISILTIAGVSGTFYRICDSDVKKFLSLIAYDYQRRKALGQNDINPPSGKAVKP